LGIVGARRPFFRGIVEQDLDMHRLFPALLSVLVSSAAFATAPPWFTGLGDLPGGAVTSTATALSADGTTVVGTSAVAAGTEAFRWRGGRMEALGALRGDRHLSRAAGVSRDGSVVAGDSRGPEGLMAFLHRDGSLVSLEGFPANSTPRRVTAIADDGRVVIGQHRTRTGPVAWWWRDDAVRVIAAPDDATLMLQALGADGGVAAGMLLSGSGSVACVVEGDAVRTLGELPGGASFSEATALSADGATVVGISASAWGHEAFRLRDGVMLGLGGLSADRALYSYAKDVSANGRIVVGHSIRSAGGTGRETAHAFVWDDVNGMRPLREVLTDVYGLDLTGWHLADAMAVSDDGLVIAGNGTNPRGETEAWVVALPPSAVTPGGLDPVDRERAMHLLHRTTINGLAGPTAVAISRDGWIAVAEPDGGRVRRFDVDGRLDPVWGDDGVVTLSCPVDLAYDADGALWALDGDEVVMLDDFGVVSSRWGGTGATPGKLNAPRGIGVSKGLVFVSDTGNARVQVFDSVGTLRRVVGAEVLGQPLGLAVDADRTIFVADAARDRVLTFDAAGRPGIELGGRGEFPGLFRTPTDVVVHGGGVHVVDRHNHRVQVFGPDGRVRAVWGRPERKPRTARGRLRSPYAYAIAPEESIAVVVEPRDDRIQIFDRLPAAGPSRFGARPPSSRIATSFGPALAADGDLLAITRPADDAIEIAVVTDESLRLLMLGHQHGAATTTMIGESGARFGQLRDPVGVAVDADDARLYVSDAGNRRVQVFALARHRPQASAVDLVRARFMQSFDCRVVSGDAPAVPGAIAVGPDGRVAFVDTANRQVVLLDANLALTAVVTPAPGGSAPIDVAVDDDGTLHILDAAGVIIDGDAQRATNIVDPAGLACGPDGRVLVTDGVGDRLFVLDADGAETIHGRRGYEADAFFKPRGVAVDGSGRVFVSDWGNARVRVLALDGTPLGAFGDALYARSGRE
jgi:probable HAF family extracellular repeat protein